MPQPDVEAERRIRLQAALQDDGILGLGTGPGADGEEDLADAPDPSDHEHTMAADGDSPNYGESGKAEAEEYARR